MGLFSTLLTLPLAPLRGVAWVSDLVLETAEKELYDPPAVWARLAALNRAYDDGGVTVEEFEREEERLLDLLEESSRRQQGTRQ
jgi:hypothetical protein